MKLLQPFKNANFDGSPQVTIISVHTDIPIVPYQNMCITPGVVHLIWNMLEQLEPLGLPILLQLLNITPMCRRIELF